MKSLMAGATGISSVRQEINRERRILERFTFSLYMSVIRNKRLLRNGHFREWLVCPMNYWRSVELPITLHMLRPKSSDKILDIGSPKLLSLFLALRIKSSVYATDLLDYFLEDLNEFREVFRLQNLTTETCDAREMHYPNRTFDKVFSVPVCEHIPGTGDIAALRQIWRVLKPGGQCLITVPYDRNGMTEYTKTHHYWIEKSDGISFYQRRYSYSELQTRLIRPAGFRVESLYFLAEKPVEEPYVTDDGTFVHNYFFLDDSFSTKLIRRSRLPYVTYLLYRWYSDRLHYISTDSTDSNVRNVALHLQKLREY